MKKRITLNEFQNTNEPNKYFKLILGILFDLIGMISYSIPWVGEFSDVVWAPLSGLILSKMYPGKVGKIAGIIGFIEEAIPFTDVIPTFTITWFYVYVFKKEK
jgi:hypothetical protein